ncbi:hypothetical protein ODJ67_30685, partial [Pseudomonas aeruginosa]|nr:hypothetical protein [Pseudomonas aeruginosa]
RFAAELVGVLTAVKGGAQITAKLPTAAKNLVNAIAESPVSGSMSSQLGKHKGDGFIFTALELKGR